MILTTNLVWGFKFKQKDFGFVEGSCTNIVLEPFGSSCPGHPRIKAVNRSSKGHWNYSVPSDPSDSMIAKIRFSQLAMH